MFEMEVFFSYYIPLILVGIFFLLGFLGSFLPIIPASFVVWLGIFIHKIWLGENSVSWKFFWIATGLALLAQILDAACTYWGARRFGASWKGAVGALAGLVLGPFLLTPIVGLLAGPILGAIAGELINGQKLRHASKAGVGTIVGNLVSFILKLGIVCGMITGFYISLYSS